MILMAGGFARYPIAKRIPEVKIPVAFMYGQTDWMTSSHADEIMNQLHEDSKVYTVSCAGH